MKYLIRELQNLQSTRDGTEVQCETLRGAKMAASKRQCFEGTVMTIENTDGRQIAYKKDGQWHDVEVFWPFNPLRTQ